MTVRFTHLPQVGPAPGLVVEFYHGATGVHDIIEVFAAEISAGVRRPGLRALCDFRNATVDASAAQLAELVEWVLDHEEYMRDARWAVVVDRLEVARVSRRLADHHLPRIGAESRIFESVEAACGWLGVPTIEPREIGPQPPPTVA